MLVVPMLLMYGGGINIVKAEEDSLEYTCKASVPLIGELEFGMLVDINRSMPDTVEPGEDFLVDDLYTNIEIVFDGDTIDTIKGLINPLKGEVNGFNLVAENAVNTADPNSNIVNVAGDGIRIPETPIGDDDEGISIRVPGEGVLDAGFTASESGDIEMSVGTIVATIETSLLNVVGECTPDEGQNLSLGTINIEEAAEPIIPELIVVGVNPLYLNIGEEYTEYGVMVDGEIVEDVDISGEVNTDVAGEYTVIYTMTYMVGDEERKVTAERIVIVEEAKDPEDPGDDTGGMWFNGNGKPSSDLGENGDLYLDEETFDIYKKENNEWTKIGNIKGEDGSDGHDGQDGIGGATWLVGEGEPGAEQGVEGDLYLDTASGDVYLKSEDGWSMITNIKGEPGEDGQDGQDGEDGKDGKDGQDGEDGKDGKDGKDDKGVTGNGKAAGDKGTGGQLPKTATNTPLIILIGSLMSIVGGALVFIRRRVLN